MSLLLGLAFAAPARLARLAELPAAYGGAYVGTSAPLAPTPFRKLPIGAIRPLGWLRRQLVLEANGYTGHLDRLSEFLNPKNNAWLSPTGVGEHGWEEAPYWLRGFGDLGYVLGDRRLIARAKPFIEAALASQRPDGYFGPSSNLVANSGKPDVWPNMLMLAALQSYYEYSGDPRVLRCMARYFKWELSIPDQDFLLSYWEPQRAGDNLQSAYWLYDRTRDPSALALARKLERRSADWTDGIPNFHGVNFAQGFREPAEASLQDGDLARRAATERDYDAMRAQFGQVPGGLYAADENARKGYADPRQATETCTMVEMMRSDEMLLDMFGDPRWADRCEDVAFNSLPAAMTPDLKALHYLTAPNMVRLDPKNRHPDFDNSGDMLSYDPYDYRCCQHNSGMGWPYFAEHLWLATPDRGLAAAIYAPCSVVAKAGDGAPVSIAESTDYPFRERVAFKFRMARPERFKLALRLPGWCAKASLTLNGVALPLPAARRPGRSDYAVIERRWRSGDDLVLRLPMATRVVRWPAQHGAVSVLRGPLAFSLRIGEAFTRSGGTDAWPAQSVAPTTPWNFGLLLDRPFRVVLKPFPKDGQPFAPEASPIELIGLGRRIPGWREDALGVVGLLQASPAQTAAPIQSVTLVPMGAARLRIAAFPTVRRDGEGHPWTPAG